MNKRTLKVLYTFLILILAFTTYGFTATFQSDDGSGDDITVNITQIDTTEFPLVTLYISVLDKNGEPYGIDPNQLIIEENGQDITADRIEGVGGVGALTTMLVMDVSGSMNTAGKLTAAKNVAIDYINQMRSGDQAGIIVFNTDISYVQPLTGSKEDLINAIGSLTAKDDTAMYDAISNSIEILEPVSGRKVVIALTDGLDNRSVNRPEDVIKNIGPSGLSISTVGLGVAEQGSGALSALDEAALQELAENAGGRYGYAEDEAGLASIYDLYGRSLQSEYVLTYMSPSDLRDGVKRKINVKLNTAEPRFAESEYNPGGLVPEVSDPAPWIVFLAIIIGLIILFIIPLIINRTGHSAKSGKIKFSNSKRSSKSRIKLK